MEMVILYKSFKIPCHTRIAYGSALLAAGVQGEDALPNPTFHPIQVRKRGMALYRAIRRTFAKEMGYRCVFRSKHSISSNIFHLVRASGI